MSYCYRAWVRAAVPGSLPGAECPHRVVLFGPIPTQNFAANPDGVTARGGSKGRLIKREALTQVAVRVGERWCVALVLARAAVAGSRRSACGRASARSRPRPRPRPSARVSVPHSPQRVHRPPQRLGQPPDKNNIHLIYSATVAGRVDRFNKVIIYRQKYFK